MLWLMEVSEEKRTSLKARRFSSVFSTLIRCSLFPMVPSEVGKEVLGLAGLLVPISSNEPGFQFRTSLLNPQVISFCCYSCSPAWLNCSAQATFQSVFHLPHWFQIWSKTKRKKNILHTANWLMSRTYPLIHLQLGSPFLKPQSAEQCLRELFSALETALGTGGSCWRICGRELLLQVITSNSGGDCEPVTPLRCFLCRALGACLVHVIIDNMTRNPFRFF